ncbi:hypothetical protein L1856_05765 [Streptomyces sp. Tue 6430]|nr:hypothetical protein [Streptomyces sp. Tue 6430]
MPENASATELTSQYTAQVTADLERNTKEQDRVGGEIAALNEQLAALQRDHAVLVSIQQAIGAVTPAPSEAAQPSDSPAVPAPRKKAAAKSGAGKRTRAKKPASKASAAAQKAAPASADKAGPSKPAQPSVVDLVRGHLAGQSEPRSAAEIAEALGQAHAGRTFKTTVVRSALEGLVAKNQAQRTKQGPSVFYTATDVADVAQAAEPSQTEEQQPAPVA